MHANLRFPADDELVLHKLEMIVLVIYSIILLFKKIIIILFMETKFDFFLLLYSLYHAVVTAKKTNIISLF